MAVDVTEQVVSKQQLKASESRFRQAIEQAPVAILILKGEDLVLETANPAMLTLMDRTIDSIGQPLSLILPELSGQNLLALTRQVYQSGEPHFGWHQPVQLNRNGQLQTGYFNVSYTPFYEGSIITGVLQVVSEVSDQVLAHQALQLSEQRYRNLSAQLESQVQERTQELAASNEELIEFNLLLRRSNDNLQKFAYVASHDLQEPLRKIQQFGDLLKTRYTSPSSEAWDYLERMQNAASRMSTLIRDLLSFSRISTKRDTSTTVSLETVIQNVLVDLELVIQETGATIQKDPLPTLSGDASQLGQLFSNLLSNALKFRRPGVPSRIFIHCQRVLRADLPAQVKPVRLSSSFYRIDVIDNGIGFDEKYLDRIFEVFQRLHGKREYAGTGIGLAICEKVVANHGGAIMATSQEGKGATFSVYLPL